MISPGEKNRSPGSIRVSLGKLGRWTGLETSNWKGTKGAVVGALAIDVSLSEKL